MPNIPRPREGKPPKKLASGFPLFYGTKRLPRVITGDLWSYIKHACIERLHPAQERKALSYVEQAHDFFLAASNPRQASRPLLYYYAFLNLAKVLLLHRGVPLPVKLGHGINDPKINNKKRLRFDRQLVHFEGAATTREKVFPELFVALSDTPPATVAGDHKVRDLFGYVPAIHRTYASTTDQSERFCPIETLEVRTDGHNAWVHLTMLKRKLPRGVDQFFASPTFTTALEKVRSEDETRWAFQTTAAPYVGAALDTAIGRLAAALRELGTYVIFTDAGCRYYFHLDHKPAAPPQACVAYAIMFYLGSITRYKPYDYEKLFEKHTWLISEFIDTQPTQFLHMIASHIANADVVAPHALRTALP